MKGSRGSVAGAIVKKNTGLMGNYIFQLGDTLTPLIGTATALDISATGGYLICDPNVGGGTATFNFSSLVGIDPMSTSVLMAFRIMFPTVADPSIDISITPASGSASMNAYLPTDIPLAGAGYKGLLGVQASVSNVAFTADLGTVEHTVIVAYDAFIDTLYLYFDGVLIGTSIPTPALGTFTPKYLKAVSAATAFKIRDVHFIKFIQGSLPKKFNDLVSFYQTDPLTKLSQWAK